MQLIENIKDKLYIRSKMKKYSEKKDQLMHIKSMLISEENKMFKYELSQFKTDLKELYEKYQASKNLRPHTHWNNYLLYPKLYQIAILQGYGKMKCLQWLLSSFLQYVRGFAGSIWRQLKNKTWELTFIFYRLHFCPQKCQQSDTAQ